MVIIDIKSYFSTLITIDFKTKNYSSFAAIKYIQIKNLNSKIYENKT